jgi:hypothetical protein
MKTDSERIKELEARVEKLEARVEKLEARLKAMEPKKPRITDICRCYNNPGGSYTCPGCKTEEIQVVEARPNSFIKNGK